MKNICIDLGGTNIKAGIIENDQLLYACNGPSMSDQSFLKVMNSIEKMIDEMMKKTNSMPSEYGGIGLCMPGIIDVDNNKVLAINAKHEEASSFNFNAWAQDKYHLPIVMENDARTALVGEWQHGEGRGVNDIVMMTLGTGIGGAAMINGKLLHGKHYQAGCLGGHFTINVHGDQCNCGNIGCVESQSASWRLKELIAKAKEGHTLLNGPQEIDFKVLFDLVREGNQIAKEVIDNILKVWSAGIVNMIHAYDPDVVIVSGGIMNSKDIILPFMKEWVAKYAWTAHHSVDIKASTHTENTALWGINYLVNDKYFKKINDSVQ
ncbi:ROK family protein [Flammeovirga pacifica]|uniref:Glucokinase n=1 Tax=Flammeovirga pacifica TaxID=915059 RepID=A0A1S1YSR2_FLAPC|nr:ROK family protein [Flammeovirga pacifica]OHX63845.1 hypothetical protein NH26_19730 [Flammeovirga pacifica]